MVTWPIQEGVKEKGTAKGLHFLLSIEIWDEHLISSLRTLAELWTSWVNVQCRVNRFCWSFDLSSPLDLRVFSNLREQHVVDFQLLIEMLSGCPGLISIAIQSVQLCFACWCFPLFFLTRMKIRKYWLISVHNR